MQQLRMLEQQQRLRMFRTGIAPRTRSMMVSGAQTQPVAIAAAEQAAVISPQTHAAPAFKANIDFKAIKDDLSKYVQNCADRKAAADPSRAVALYDQFCALKAEVEALRAERNANAAQMKVRGSA
jgi:hypothetical protein